MYTIRFDASKIDEPNLIQKGPQIRLPIAVEAKGRPVTGTADSPLRDDFVPDLCLKLLQSILPLIEGKEHVISFSSSVCELTYTPGEDSTVFINGLDTTGRHLNTDVPAPGIEVPVSAVVEQHFRMSEKCYKQYLNLPLEITRHPEINCLETRILSEQQRILDHGSIKIKSERIPDRELPAFGSPHPAPMKIRSIERVEGRFGCTHRSVTLECEDGTRFGAFDSRGVVSNDQIGMIKNVELWGSGIQKIKTSTSKNNQISPSSRGNGWKNHLLRGPILDTAHLGENTLLQIDIGTGSVSLIAPTSGIPDGACVGETISTRPNMIEVAALSS